jgi:E3 ubiquitin-protein ligase HUWE1
MMATFVHNEPTSLPVIQEAGLPQAFYHAVEAGLEPMIEVRYVLSTYLVTSPLDIGHTSCSQCPRSSLP